MRFMMIVKASKDSEAGVMPSEELIAEMTKYNEELQKAGVLLDLSGLQPSSKGARIKFSGGKRTVINGPFTDSKDLIAGYWVIQVKSKEEAVQWALRAPAPHGPDKESEIELRQFFELEDFGESEAIDQARKLEAELARKK
jgi:hypothetical protein